MSEAPRLLAITPPTGELSPDRASAWCDAGLATWLAVLMRPGPGESLHSARLRSFADACRRLDLPLFWAITSEAIPAARRLPRGEGWHLKGGWTPGSVQHLIDAAGRRPLGLSGHEGDPVLPEELMERMSYRSFAPVFAPHTQDPRRPKAPAGLQALQRAAGQSETPLLALGGVTPQRVQACLEAGAHGVAAIRTLFGDPAQLRQYVDALQRAPSTRVSP